mmetsp:Transcript_2162/g.3301  ORF Transcript_2162/g.3301 Transcript_2162/m.3301 type:complete len:438 (-) Transcript_2162:559-1872(-)|eukprot:CAMPEP_0195298058 /NCGR_PEP_ID=MMETSP0707-20130614/22661_1 /TAXON_ID=33640 /ORGANISM="Asterionellopsis glacialis, Strain CCMP134" /LENGTH=437 /DNA_ID=CAMNT_0040360037 /DNA_START=133 /DNA_END=1446 /DNA_ORIENTATION=+
MKRKSGRRRVSSASPVPPANEQLEVKHRRIVVNGVGSAIADSLFSNVDIGSPAFQKYRSESPGDGGLEPGKLVLTEDFEKMTGTSASEAIREIVGHRNPDAFNLGGPCPVALLNAAQLSFDMGDNAIVRFYSTNGNDQAGQQLRQILDSTPLDTSHVYQVQAPAPITYVLSDPKYNDGSGERTFVNGILAAWKMEPEFLDDTFFDADIVLFGGTALVPKIHDNLTLLTERAQQKGCLTMVTTVYDFPNEKTNPKKAWPLGQSDATYRYLDLLITDREEALRLAGCDCGEHTINNAVQVLIGKGTKALVVTNGVKGVYCYSDGSLFLPVNTTLPVSHGIEDARKAGLPVQGDTTGAGDNFAGGVLASLMHQIAAFPSQKKKPYGLNLVEACALGIASGDFACFYMGGTFLEQTRGEKVGKINPILNQYIQEHRDIMCG